jgi:hypothetical protein
VVSDLAALASIVYVTYSARTFRRESRRLKEDSAAALVQAQHFEDVLKGVDAGPGIEARPSLVQRMASLEESHKTLDRKTDAQNVVLAKILGLLTPNHGSSLPDKVDQLTETVVHHLEAHSDNPPPSPRRRPAPKRQNTNKETES